MRCIECGSSAVSKRPKHTAQGYRRFRCRSCGIQFNERRDSVLNGTRYPSDVIALVVLWRLRYKRNLRDPTEVPRSWHRLHLRGRARLGSQAHAGAGQGSATPASRSRLKMVCHSFVASLPKQESPPQTVPPSDTDGHDLAIDGP
jgi:hypothetical protein